MTRPQLHEVLGLVVHARISMDALKLAIIQEMRQGYRPTYRGHEWDQSFFEAIEKTADALDVAFNYLKWLQFPEDSSRWREAEGGLNKLKATEDKAGHGHHGRAELPPGGDARQEDEDFLHVLP